jgi:hypothetical protein
MLDWLPLHFLHERGGGRERKEREYELHGLLKALLFAFCHVQPHSLPGMELFLAGPLTLSGLWAPLSKSTIQDLLVKMGGEGGRSRALGAVKGTVSLPSGW